MLDDNLILEDIREKLLLSGTSSLSSEKTRNTIVFLVGAGISRSSPTNLSLFPQMDCIEKISDLELIDKDKLLEKIRPEFFFQILKKYMGDENGLLPLQVLNINRARAEGFTVDPNIIHSFLAKMLELDHIVISTNFDSLIEDAYFGLYGKKLDDCRCLIYDNEFDKISNFTTHALGKLIKLHGSFVRPSGYVTEDSIVTLLSQHQSNSVGSKIRLLEVLHDYTWVVLGHSMRDEYDLYKVLSKYETCPKEIYWIKHLSKEKGSPNIISDVNVFHEKLSCLNRALATMAWNDVSEHNMYKILNTCASKGNSAHLLTVDTATLITELLSETYSKESTPANKNISEYTDNIIEKWASNLTPEQSKCITAEILQYFDRNLSDVAAWYLLYEAVDNEKTELKRAMQSYQSGKLAYTLIQRNYSSEIFEWGIKHGLMAHDLFISLEKTILAADAYSTCAGLYRQGNKITLACSFEIKALTLYLCIQDRTQETAIKIAGSLRRLALNVMEGIPDLSSIPESKNKTKFVDVLNICCDLCGVSIDIYKREGNQSGERGLNQTYNVLGLLYLRLGNYKLAEKYFQSHIDDADAARFTRESQQGYRNLSIAQMMLYIENPEITCHRENSIGNIRKCLQCLGIDPDNSSSWMLSEKPRIEFNAIYNYMKCLVFCGESNKYTFVKEKLSYYVELSELQRLIPNDTWDMQCRLLSLLCLAEVDEGRAKYYAQETLKIYNNHIEDIKKLTFGRQNYIESLKNIKKRQISGWSMCDILSIEDLMYETPYDVDTILNDLLYLSRDIQHMDII